MAIAVLAMSAGIAGAQNPATLEPASAPMSIPAGYSVHESVDIGGRVTSQAGSGAMYDTMVNLQSGPRVLGETFMLHALPGTKNTPLDDMRIFATGFGGDPYSFAKMDFSKSKLYEFSGIFRRDRQYFDYDLLGNPNIPSGQSIPVTGSTTPYAWSQVNQSPFLFNTVRRMTDTNLTLLPLSKVTFRVGYSQNIMQGPSLTPSGYQIGGSLDVLLQEFQRNSTDDFTGAVDWKPVQGTKLTFEEQIDHYKGDSYFTLDPSYLNVQEANGTKVALFANYDSLTPYVASAYSAATKSGACWGASMGGNPALQASANGVPIINPACGVISSYLRAQPTRIIYPTEIFRLQSNSIKGLSMNGDIRYTNANMNLPNYYDAFQGLTAATSASAATLADRSIAYAGNANAKRQVMAADYGIVWEVSKTVSVEDQVNFSNVHQPGTANITSATTLTTPGGANNTINYPTPTAGVASTVEGNPALGVPAAAYFGQRFLTNDATIRWDATPRTTFSLTYRYQDHLISEGQGTAAHNIPIPVENTTSGEVTIHENAGVFNAALRPTQNWDINGSIEAAYNDNAFTPMGFRQMRHYRVHTLYRAKPWATVTGAYNDVERHNNTNNQQNIAGNTNVYAGPLDHVDYSRVASVGAELFPNDHYGLDFNYSYNDVYIADNICYLGGASAATGIAAAAPANGAICPGSLGRSGAYDLGPALDFEHAPTQFGSVALMYSPTKQFRSNLGYRVNSVNGTRFYNDARDVAGSLVSTYQSPFVNVAWTVHPGLVWKADYNFYGYGEGGPSGSQYCTLSVPTAASPSINVVPCASAGVQTGMTISPAGETAPRNFHANNLTLAIHYEF
jgi:hypothetical protein